MKNKCMNYHELEVYFSDLLHPEQYRQSDPSQNGIQVANDGSPITCVAFAVDACFETIERAASFGSQMLFVHHGLLWGTSLSLTGIHYKRIASLMRHNIALYACHLPLDANDKLGNNYGIAQQLSLHNLKPFGIWHNYAIGVQGVYENAKTIDDIVLLLFPDGGMPKTILPFGKKNIQTVAIVSGGGADEIDEAIEKNCDLFITGEITHETYHTALESKITVIAAGHYQSETVGVQLVKQKLEQDTGLKTVFIDVPTGL